MLLLLKKLVFMIWLKEGAKMVTEDVSMDLKSSRVVISYVIILCYDSHQAE